MSLVTLSLFFFHFTCCFHSCIYTWPFNNHSLFHLLCIKSCVGVSVSPGCSKKIPQTGWIKQQTFIFHSSWWGPSWPADGHLLLVLVGWGRAWPFWGELGRGVSGELRGQDHMGLAVRGARRSWEQGKAVGWWAGRSGWYLKVIARRQCWKMTARRGGGDRVEWDVDKIVLCKGLGSRVPG